MRDTEQKPVIIVVEFEIGGRYRNRRGEFEVVSLDHPAMQIRYDNGELHTVDVITQRRIVTNMTEEADLETMLRQQQEAKAAARAARIATKRTAPRAKSLA